MRGRSRLGKTIAALLTIGALAPAAASAAPPPNDSRTSPQPIQLGSSVNGTTVDSTREDSDPASGCSQDGGSVWYRVTTPRAGRVIVQLAANGDLDAVVDVFRVRRSQLIETACDITDDRGRSSFDFNVGNNETYLVRVAQLTNSAANSFRLTVQIGRPPAEPPGAPLPRKGATGTLNRVLIPSVAYSVKLRAGTTYRFNLNSQACTRLSIYPPNSESFDDDPALKTLRCGGYTQFTPGVGEGGRYSLLAEAPGRRGDVSYRLTAGRTQGDDTAPGRFIHNYARVKGHLDGNRLDGQDLYRFDVARPSDLTLALDTSEDFTVKLITAGGRRIESGTQIDVRLRPGRYFAAVRASKGASGSYRLRRVSRTITRTRVSVNGHREAKVKPGEQVTLAAHVLPGVRGPVLLQIERYDPVYGWQFYRSFRKRAGRDGRVSLGFNTPSVGRWRVQARYLGTRQSSPSDSRLASWKVQRPLTE
jgi:hypothetical protein